MKVIVASQLGMCFGVRNAIKAALGATDPRDTTILGELVHNPEVTGQLAALGFSQKPEGDLHEAPDTRAAMITAHGVSDKRRTALTDAGISLIDTTCPLVRHVHDSAQQLKAEGRFVVVIGKAGHAEVEGIVGDLERFAIVAGARDARDFGHKSIGIVCQSTTPPEVARETVEAIRKANPSSDISFVDTVCRPTRHRQKAVLDLLHHIDILVVAGGWNSNNTRQLASLAHSRGVPVMLVERAADLDVALLRRYRVAGLTAGTSTLDSTITEIYDTLLRVRPAAFSPFTARIASTIRQLIHTVHPGRA